MRFVVIALFLATGIVNLLPVIGVASDAQLTRLYRVDAFDADVALLLRHRAVLFGIVGGLLCAAAFVPALRGAATLAGLASMVSFCVLVLLLEPTNASLIRIAWIDVVASVALLAAYGLSRLSPTL